MEIKEFNKSNLSVVRQLLNAKLAELEKEIGVQFNIGNIRYTSNSFKASLEAFVGSNGQDDRAKQDWELYAPMFGLSKDLFGKTIVLSGRKFIVAGIKTRARKNNIIIKDERNGKEFVTSSESVARAAK